MTKLTYSKKIKIFVLICALILSIGFSWIFLYFLFTEPRSLVTWSIIFPCFVLFISLSVISIREAFCSYCSFDDEKGIELYSGIKKIKKLPVSSIDSFFVFDNGISISYKKVIKGEEKVKSFTVSNYFQNLQSLYEWLDSHARNFYKEQLTQSFEEFNEAHSELTNHEKNKFLQKAYFLAKILKWTGAIIAILLFASLFINKSFMKVSLIVCGIYPFFLFLIMRFSNGAIRFNTKKSDLYPSLLSPFCFCSAALLYSSTLFLDQIYSYFKQLCISGLIALIMFLFYYTSACKSEKQTGEKKSSRIIAIISIIFLMFNYGLGFSIPTNILFNKSEPIIYEVTITNQRVSKGKHTDYYLEVTPWIDGKKNNKEISVRSRVYSEVEIGDKVYINLYKGFLGVPWYNTETIKNNNNIIN